MARKQHLQELKEFIKVIKNRFILHVSTQEEDKEEKEDLFESCLEKIKKTIGE